MEGLYTKLNKGERYLYNKGTFCIGVVEDAIRDLYFPKRGWAVRALKRMDENNIEDDKMRELLKKIIND